MSNQQPLSGGPIGPSIPRGDVLGTYDSYVDAQQVIDKLAKADFDVRQLAIVGSDLKTIERITGKLSYGRSALGGAATGAWFGLFAGTVLFLFAATPNVTYALAVILIGAAFGMLFGIVSYAINRRRKDYRSVNQVVASSYQVIVPPSQLVRAQELLQRPGA
ncbi:MAG TPA: general stress protein [Galbitalea sp.]|nr:general stress protein [Galbitalea sp.]